MFICVKLHRTYMSTPVPEHQEKDWCEFRLRNHRVNQDGKSQAHTHTHLLYAFNTSDAIPYHEILDIRRPFNGTPDNNNIFVFDFDKNQQSTERLLNIWYAALQCRHYSRVTKSVHSSQSIIARELLQKLMFEDSSRDLSVHTMIQEFTLRRSTPVPALILYNVNESTPELDLLVQHVGRYDARLLICTDRILWPMIWSSCDVVIWSPVYNKDQETHLLQTIALHIDQHQQIGDAIHRACVKYGQWVVHEAHLRHMSCSLLDVSNNDNNDTNDMNNNTSPALIDPNNIMALELYSSVNKVCMSLVDEASTILEQQHLIPRVICELIVTYIRPIIQHYADNPFDFMSHPQKALVIRRDDNTTSQIKRLLVMRMPESNENNILAPRLLIDALAYTLMEDEVIDVYHHR